MQFEFNETKYQASTDASQIYRRNLAIKLPDGSFLRVISWRESMPPQPVDYRVLKGAGRTGYTAAVIVE